MIPEDSYGDLHKVARIRQLLDEAYDHYFAHGGGDSKSMEGYISVESNTYHDRKAGYPLTVENIKIYSYVLGPGRLHEFHSVDEALSAVQEWHRKEMSKTYNDS